MKFNNENKKIKIDILLFIFLSLLIFAWFDHLFRFLFSILGNGYINNPKLCTFMALILFVIFIIFIKMYVEIEREKIIFIDIVLLCIGVIYFLLKVPFPENMFDTVCYELHIQEFPFVDWVKTNQSFMDKSYLYALGDRVYYYFRIIFGYRLSILPNLLIYLISYFKIKEILKYFYNNYFENRNEDNITKLVIPMMTMMCLLSEYFVAGMYLTKIDIFIVPIFLECIRLSFCKDNLHIEDYIYSSLLIGLAIAIKINFAIILIPLIVYILLKNRKHLNIKVLSASIIPCMIILSIYIIHTYISVGNITYPYYNWIFKSQYASLERISWDERWGPKTFVEKIAWPIYIFFKPGRYSELPFNSGRLALGYIVGIIAIIANSFYKKFKSTRIILIFIANVLLWSYTSGYSRYGIANDIFAGIIICLIILELLIDISKNNKQVNKNICTIIISIFVINFMYAQAIITYRNIDWKGNNNSLFVSELNFDRGQFLKDYVDNSKRLFRDRGKIISDNKEEIEGVLDKVKLWIDANNNMYYMMLKNDAKIYMDNSAFTEEVKEKKRRELYKLYKRYGKEGIYAIGESALGYDYAKEKYSELGLEIEETYNFEVDFIKAGDKITLYHLVPNEIFFNENLTLEEKEYSIKFPLILSWKGGFSDLEGTKDENWRWCSNNGKLEINNTGNTDRKINVEMEVFTDEDKLSEFEIDSQFFSDSIQINSDGKKISKTIIIPPGNHIIEFHSNAQQVISENDPRNLVFRVVNFKYNEVK